MNDIFVIELLNQVRACARFPHPVCDIIAGYAMTVGDLLAYMPHIWHNSDEEPYLYPCAGDKYFRVWVLSTTLTLIPSLHTIKLSATISLRNASNLFARLHSARFACAHTGEMSNYIVADCISDDSIHSICIYYEMIASECLAHLLRSQYNE